MGFGVNKLMGWMGWLERSCAIDEVGAGLAIRLPIMLIIEA